MLEIRKERDGELLTVYAAGRLDTTTAPELAKELESEFENTEKLVLDFEELEYISSAGLRVLLGAHKAMNERGSMVVTHVNELVGEVFEVTGFSEILTIE